MSKISLNDNMMDVVMNLSEGNPGAVTVLMQIMQDAEKIDPQAVFGPLGVMMALDTHEVYGPRIWMFYKDVCKEDLVLMLAALRSVQLGMRSEADLNHAIDTMGQDWDNEEILKAVQEQLEAFAPWYELV